MKILLRLTGTILANGLGIWLAARYLKDFQVTGGLAQILLMALILTALNAFLKPVLKLLFGPIIIITLGFGFIIVNAVIIYFLDIASESLSIVSIPAFIYSSLIISAVNIIAHLFI